MKLFSRIFLFCCVAAPAFGQNTWFPVDSLNGSPKSVATSFVLNDEGYVVGGLTDGSFSRKMYSYNIAQDDWDAEPSWGGELGSGQNRGSAVSFVINEKAYVGLGQGNTAGFYNDFWEYNPLDTTWTQKANFTGSARRSAVGFSIDGIGYVGTGQDEAGMTRDFFSYDAITNSWNQLNNFTGTARKSAVAFTLGGNAYIGTGDDGVLLKDFWQYNPTTDSWIQRPDLPGMSRAGAVAWGEFPTGFISCGEDANGVFLKDLWEYNFFGNVWQQRADLPGPARKHATAFCINGIGFVGSGYNDIFLDDFYAYIPLLGTNELEQTTLEVYPNPATEQLILRTEYSFTSLIVTDANGKIIPVELTSTGENANLSMQLEGLSSGHYFIAGETKNGQFVHTSFIKIP